MITALQQVLNGLTSEQREILMAAFNRESDVYVEYKEGFYIGVNLPDVPVFKQTESRGVWSIGEIRK